MKLVLYNDYQLGVLHDGHIHDAMAAVAGQSFRRPMDLMEEVITGWAELRPRIAAAAAAAAGMPLDSVRLRAPVPKPTKLICAALNYLEFGQRQPAILDAFLKSPTAIIGNGDHLRVAAGPRRPSFTTSRNWPLSSARRRRT